MQDYMNISNPAASKASNYNDFSGLAELRLKAGDKPGEAAREVAQQFESIFVGMMMKSMRATLPKDGMFSSHQMDAYQDMFDKQLALDLSNRGGLGLADMIERQISASSMFKATAEE